MIIWRGWGILAVLIGLAGIGGGAALASSLNVSNASQLMLAGLGALLAAVGNWFLGLWFNKTRPQAKVDAYMGQRTAMIQQSVERGDFSLGPGHARPRSREEAQTQADWLLGQERTELRSAFNQHSVFWIPMQWFSVLLAGAGLLLLVLGFTS